MPCAKIASVRIVNGVTAPLTGGVLARMKRLYGVTMAERGVSPLVSVDLPGAVKLREAS